MSSLRADERNPGAGLVLVASLGALLWYGWGQLLYSLAFLYHIAQAIFPFLAAIRSGS
jgi:hypothetical protein